MGYGDLVCADRVFILQTGYLLPLRPRISIILQVLFLRIWNIQIYLPLELRVEFCHSLSPARKKDSSEPSNSPATWKRKIGIKWPYLCRYRHPWQRWWQRSIFRNSSGSTQCKSSVSVTRTVNHRLYPYINETSSESLSFFMHRLTSMHSLLQWKEKFTFIHGIDLATQRLYILSIMTG